MGTRDRVLLIAAFAAVYIVWGSTYLAIAWAIEAIPPMAMIGARCILAGGVLYGWARLRGGRRPDLADWRAAAVAGVLLFVTGQAMLAWAETRIPSGPAALILATEPLFIVLLGWLGGPLGGSKVRGARPSGRAFLALAVGFLGVAVMVLPGGGGAVDGVGAAAALIASASWSVGVLRASPRPRMSAVQMAGMQLLCAGVVLGPVSLVIGEEPRLAALTTRGVLAFLYLVVFGSIVTYAAYVWLLERVGPNRLSTHAYVNPVVAVTLGALLANERVTSSILVATVLILASVVVLVRREPAAVAAGGDPTGPGDPDDAASSSSARRRDRDPARDAA